MRSAPLLLALFLASGAALTACGSPGDTLPAGSSVDAGTSPEDVVRSYLGALQDDDAAAAEALVTGSESGGPWISDPPRIEDVVVSEATPESTVGTAGEGHDEAVFVPVTFDLHGADETMPDGPTTWGYVLVRDGDGPWRIAGQGST